MEPKPAYFGVRPSGTRLEDDQRYLAVGPLLVSGVALVQVDHPRPQALALLRTGHPRVDVELAPAHLNRRSGVGAKVVVPGGMARMAALRGHDHDLLAIGQIGERRGPRLAALGAHVVEQKHRRD